MFFLTLGLCAAMELHSRRARQSFWVLDATMIGEYNPRTDDKAVWTQSLKGHVLVFTLGTSSAGTTATEERPALQRRKGPGTFGGRRSLLSCSHVPKVTRITTAEKSYKVREKPDKHRHLSLGTGKDSVRTWLQGGKYTSAATPFKRPLASFKAPLVRRWCPADSPLLCPLTPRPGLRHRPAGGTRALPPQLSTVPAAHTKEAIRGRAAASAPRSAHTQPASPAPLRSVRSGGAQPAPGGLRGGRAALWCHRVAHGGAGRRAEAARPLRPPPDRSRCFITSCRMNSAEQGRVVSSVRLCEVGGERLRDSTALHKKILLVGWFVWGFCLCLFGFVFSV